MFQDTDYVQYISFTTHLPVWSNVGDFFSVLRKASTDTAATRMMDTLEAFRGFAHQSIMDVVNVIARKLYTQYTHVIPIYMYILYIIQTTLSHHLHILHIISIHTIYNNTYKHIHIVTGVKSSREGTRTRIATYTCYKYLI